MNRTLRRLSAATATAVLACASPAKEASAPTTPGMRDISYQVSEGTWMTVDVSPDGSTILFDLIGHLYTMPIAGGKATALTTGRDWHRGPRYSPDGSQIAVIRDGGGPDEVWIMPAKGGEPRRLTDHSNSRFGWAAGTPSWAPDGKSIFTGESTNDYENNLLIKRVDVATAKVTKVDSAAPEAERRTGVLAPNGKIFYFSEHHAPPVSTGQYRRTTLVRVDLSTGKRTVMTDSSAGVLEYTPTLSRDGKWIAYIRRDRKARSALRVGQLAEDGSIVAGSDRELLPLPDDDDPFRFDTSEERPSFAFTPDGAAVVIGAGGKIHRVSVSDGADQVIPFTAQIERQVPPVAKAKNSLPDGPLQVHGIQWPRLSPDGKTLVFGAVGYIWVQGFPDGEPKRLTKADTNRFEFMPALSPDGSTVAYIELAKQGVGATHGRLMTVPLAGGEPKVILSGPKTYLAPSWSPDGSKLAVIRDAGANSSFEWVSLSDRVSHKVAPVQAAQRETWGRMIGFTKDGQRLWYSWEHDKGGLPDSSEIRVIPLAGGTPKSLAVLRRDARGMVLAPNGRSVLVMGIDDDLQVFQLPEDGSTVRSDLAGSTFRRLTRTGAEFVDWRDDSTFIYSFGNKIYRHGLNKPEPQLIHTVRLSVPRREGQGVVAFTNARIITVNGTKGAGDVIEKGTLVIQGRRIVAVGRSESVKVPEGARVIDGTGLTLMPAIGDMHYHSQGGTNLLSKMLFPRSLAEESSDDAELGLREAVPYGVTFGWQPGGPTRNGGGLALAELREAGRIPGPRWINAPWAVNMVTYGDNDPGMMGTYQDALRITQHRRDLDGLVMKEYMTRRRDHRQWFGDAARAVGVAIVSHVEGLDMGLSRAADGYTGFDHPPFAVPVYDDVRQFLARTGTSWTPNTNVTTGNEYDFSEAQRAFVREVVHRWPDQAAKWREYYPTRKLDSTPPVKTLAETRQGRVIKAAAYLMAGGVKIGISAHNPPSLYAHAEMWYLQQAGAPAADVIRAGTMTGAEKMGLDKEIGSLEVGKVADVLVLEGNPLDDVLNTVAQRYVVADGVVVDVRVRH